ncbi:MAG: exodeoxyribonuclease V subunit gamma [Candidatus Fermentithermobacillus carboniphilus]|uniref:Exodeoxyribonuclease V subunit gamma n=1 Tax=Candidatus Fermentithermobacillus carboniphilus TaxID=3085328 RepID=A0AAT9LGR6_9FIRM|nr:MAG: exodeoxyribonuclease V subunit gamma [Candidatus Fermentithermobacillus carboniphilus]
MSLRFIIGPAGSGKTKYIVDSITKDLLSRTAGPGDKGRGSIILLVPDQATFQMEREILESGVAGFFDLHVLSFRRLCMRVLDETGRPPRPFITPAGKSMAIQSILWRRKKDLTVFASMVNYPRFRDTLSRTFSELGSFNLTPADLRAVKNLDASPFLSQKIHDLELVWDEYRRFLEGRFLDPDDYLDLAIPGIGRSILVSGASFWIDGFSGFTPREYTVLEEILAYARDVNVALCMDREELQYEPSELSLFHPTREAYEKISALAKKRGVALEPAVILGETGVLPRFEKSKELLLLEERTRNKWRKPGRQAGENSAPDSPGGFPGYLPVVQTSDGASSGVFLVSATNPRAEVEFVAREILKLVRDEGFRFKDITVELRDIERYAELISLVFKDYGIPFFLDRKRSLSHHPLAELVRAALDVVLTGFSFEPVFRFLKTDLVPVDREEVDRLENYVLAYGIKGEKWVSPEPWKYRRRYYLGEDEEPGGTDQRWDSVDATRRKAVESLGKFYSFLRENTHDLPAGAISRAIYDLLVDLKVPERLSAWQKEAEEQGDLARALEHAGIWDKLLEILEQAAEILKDQPCDLRSYASLLNAGLEDIRLGTIPPSLDEVLVGSLDRSRQPSARATFLLGALEGVLPKRHDEEGIFTDREREIILSSGIDIEPSSRIRQLHEKYLVYIALTRPSERLYVTYPLGDEEGKSLTPSWVVDHIKKVFPEKEEITVSVDPPGLLPEDLDYVVPARAYGILNRRLALLRQGLDPGPVWKEVYRWLVSPERLPVARKILGSLNYTQKVAPLGKSLAMSLYGTPLITSVSRLETFQACPFQHFAEDGLGLKERELFRLDPAGAGTFLHEALREFALEIIRSGKRVQDLSRDEARQIMDNVVDVLVPKISNELFLSSARYKYVAGALRRILRRGVDLFYEHFRRGEFLPAAPEVPFGFRGTLPPLTVDLQGGEKVLVRGKIDRVDFAVAGKEVFVRVVDYKSSYRRFDLLDVFYGLSLQLLVYLLAAVSFWPDILDLCRSLGSNVRSPGEAAEKTLDTASLGPGGLKGTPAGALYFAVRDPLVKASGPLEPDMAESEVRKNLKMTGALLGEPDVLRRMDGTSSGRSDIIPVEFTKSGVGGRSSTLSRGDFEVLFHFVREKIRETAESILAGCIDIAPYRKNQERPCTYCPYGPLCTFDVLLEGNEYRILKRIPKEEVFNEIRKRLEGGISRD